MFAKHGELRFGVAGWSAPNWVGRVYPKAKNFDGLFYLSQFLDTIEINTTFYNPGNPSQCKSWIRRVSHNPYFKFTAKLHRLFTHEMKKPYTMDDVEKVKNSLGPLVDAGKLGALLIQFSPFFRYDPEAWTRLTNIVEQFSEFPLAVEVKNRGWNRPDFYKYLEEHQVAYVQLDHPTVKGTIPPNDRTTSKVGYMRLQGQDYSSYWADCYGLNTPFNVLYPDHVLDYFAKLLSNINQNTNETYVIFNNNIDGQCVCSALQMKAKLLKEKVNIPKFVLEYFPMLEEIAEEEFDSVQKDLF
ncbi:DUF72 domain-containing protein [candidate division KSB1 bacterium]|nr:DUF72 domain-containing protein [candidate division KSB1 bacterium]